MSEVEPQPSGPMDAASASHAGAGGAGPSSAALEDDQLLVEALRRGDEAAFMRLVSAYHQALERLALVYVSTRETAEEVVQETWIGVLRGVDRFEGRSSLKTWIFRILVHTAKTHAQREGRSVPFSSLADSDPEAEEPAVEPQRFLPPDDPHWPGHWASIPRRWDEMPEQRLLSGETLAHVEQAIHELPPNQRSVIELRDIEGYTSEEVCNVLGISETNQRVLLHRARSKVRGALEVYFDEGRTKS